MSTATESLIPGDGDDDSEKMVTLSRAQIRSLEKKAKERDDLAKQVETFTRNQVFAEAGIDPKDPKQQYFIKGYEGEVTPDAIRQAATEAGFLSEPELSPEQSSQLDATQRMASASAGATPRGAMDEATMKAEMEKAAAEGGPDAIMAVARKYGAVSTEDFQ